MFNTDMGDSYIAEMLADCARQVARLADLNSSDSAMAKSDTSASRNSEPEYAFP